MRSVKPSKERYCFFSFFPFFRQTGGKGASSRQRTFLYIKMELCKGTLKQWLDKVGANRPSTTELLRIFSSINEAVVYIHSRGLIHRDLKVFCGIFFFVSIVAL
jgi:serine/threonine protein kinase